MGSLLRLALVQMHVDAGNPDANYARLETKLNEAVQGPVKPDMVMLPEMWNTGYALEQIDELADPDGERTKALSRHSAVIIRYKFRRFDCGKTLNGVYNTTYVFNEQGENPCGILQDPSFPAYG